MLNRQKNSQGFTKRKARLREDIILESKLAINFISKLIYWFNFLLIYFLHQGASPVSYRRL